MSRKIVLDVLQVGHWLMLCKPCLVLGRVVLVTVDLRNLPYKPSSVVYLYLSSSVLDAEVCFRLSFTPVSSHCIMSLYCPFRYY
jgi:hypothetical protein